MKWRLTSIHPYLAPIFFAALLVGPPRSPSWPPAVEASDEVKVLFIGNSFTFYNDLPGMLEVLARENHKRVAAKTVARGGATLQDHWDRGDAVKTLREGHWDFVVLQDRSGRVRSDPEVVLTSARLFDDEIEKVGAKTLLYVTPTYKGQVEAQQATLRGYAAVAESLGATVVPVGVAFHGVYSALPDVELHAQDRVHPGPKGTLLAAVVFYAVIFGDLPEILPAANPGINLDDAEKTLFRKSVRSGLGMK